MTDKVTHLNLDSNTWPLSNAILAYDFDFKGLKSLNEFSLKFNRTRVRNDNCLLLKEKSIFLFSP